MENHVALAAERNREGSPSTAAHTPGPWRLGDPDYETCADNFYPVVAMHQGCQLFGRIIAYGLAGELPQRDSARANAERIVQCCNAHDDMLAALQAFSDFARRDEQSGDSDLWTDDYRKLIEDTRAALAKAGAS